MLLPFSISALQIECPFQKMRAMAVGFSIKIAGPAHRLLFTAFFSSHGIFFASFSDLAQDNHPRFRARITAVFHKVNPIEVNEQIGYFQLAL